MKIKYIPDAINNRLDTGREKFSEFKDIAIETTQNAAQRNLKTSKAASMTHCKR